MLNRLFFCYVLTALLFCIPDTGYSQPAATPSATAPENTVQPAAVAAVEPGKDQIAILDVISASLNMEPGKLSILTDVFRTEIFKLNLFKVLDRSYIEKILNEQKLSMSGVIKESNFLKIGQLLAVEKLFICTIERFGSTLAVNVRIINVETSLVDYTENVFIKDENMLFNALKEIVKNIELYYKVRGTANQPQNVEERQKTKWIFLGATDTELSQLIEHKIEPEKFLDIRQYDISFSLTEFLNAYNKGWDFEVIKTFLRSGISYEDTKKALGFGILNLDSFNQQFRPAGFKFDEYLEAYSKHLTTSEEYKDYRKGFKKDGLAYGLGGVANSIPIANSDFKFPLLVFNWEHFLTEFQRGSFKRSVDVGMFLFNGIAPAPYSQYNWYMGEYPFYFKTGAGLVAELFLGGHVGAYIHMGVEVKEKYEFSVIIALLGTQPGVSYTDFKSKPGDPKYVGITYPYCAAALKFK
ncbi:MAG: CsgG/HfaB family protein [Elusimicrobiota bacterium]